MKLVVWQNNSEILSVDFRQEIQDLDGGLFSFFIGRDSTCAVVLNDKQVSREHAKISYKDGRWEIEKTTDIGDLFLNGRPILESSLSHQDQIKISGYILEILIESHHEGMTSSSDSFKADSSSRPVHSLNESMDYKIDNDFSTEDEFKSNSNMDQFQADDSFGDNGNYGNDEDIKNKNQPIEEYGTGLDDESFKHSSEAQNYYEEQSQSNGDGEDQYQQGQSEIRYDVVDGEKTEVFRGFNKVLLSFYGQYAPFEKMELVDGRTYIGRDSDKCKICIQDPEISSQHVIIDKTGVLCTLEDLDSANGTILNGETIKKKVLKDGDEIVIGSTTIVVTITSEFLKQEQDRLMPVAENQKIEVEEIVEVEEDDDNPVEIEDLSVETSKSLFSKDSLTNPDKRKKILMILVFLLVLWVVLEEEPAPDSKTLQTKQQNKKKNQEDSQDGAKESQSPAIKLTQEQEEMVNAFYEIAYQKISEGDYQTAIGELEKIHAIIPEFKNSKVLLETAKTSYAKIEELEKQRQKEIDEKIRQEKVNELLKRARQAVDDRKAELARALFTEVISLDPENFDVSKLKIEIDAWEKEEREKKQIEEQKRRERLAREELLRPSRNLYLQKKWYEAINKLREFLSIKEMDEDLIKDASVMLENSENELKMVVEPLLAKARSLREAQDLKAAYETYKDILLYHPGHLEALTEKEKINEVLKLRARKVYREALISESLSLFDEAKEKFQEVQQIAPSDSEYYEKSSEKLKEYWE